MTYKDEYVHVQNLISRDHVEEAFQFLTSEIRNSRDKKFTENIILLRNRYARNETKHYLYCTDEQYSAERIKICKRLLEISASFYNEYTQEHINKNIINKTMDIDTQRLFAGLHPKVVATTLARSYVSKLDKSYALELDKSYALEVNKIEINETLDFSAITSQTVEHLKFVNVNLIENSEISEELQNKVENFEKLLSEDVENFEKKLNEFNDSVWSSPTLDSLF